MTATPAVPPPPAAADRILPGIGLMLLFCTIAPVIDVASKFAVQTLPAGTVTLARFVVQAALMAPVALAMRLPARLSWEVAGLTILRALAAICATFCFIAALLVMPIADALAVAFVSPFILLLMGRFLLGEEVGPRRLAAAAVGFAGTVLVIQPSFTLFGAMALFPVGSAFWFALYMLVTRRLSRIQHPVTMQLHTAIAASVLCLPLLALGDAFGVAPIALAVPQGTAWVWCLMVGLAATVSHMAMTYALSLAPSSTLAPLNYLEIVSATTLGFLFFGDFPAGMTWTGIAIIVSSGLYVIHRERVVHRRRAAGSSPSSPAADAATAPIPRSAAGRVAQ